MQTPEDDCSFNEKEKEKKHHGTNKEVKTIFLTALIAPSFHASLPESTYIGNHKINTSLSEHQKERHSGFELFDPNKSTQLLVI